MTLLEVENLSKTYPGRMGWTRSARRTLHALAGISFTVDAGEALGIVGESGCGKSTAARTMMGLLKPDTGVVRLAGEDLLRLSTVELRQRRRHFQMVFQDPASALSPRLRVGEALTEAARVHGLARGRAALARLVEAALAEVGLPPSAAARWPHEFSGGQKQRVGIARALVLGPRLIVADEPVSALDVSVQAQILNLLMDLKRQRGIAFVFISHDLGVVRLFCERTCVMYLGRIVESGPTPQLFDRPLHPYTRLLRDVSPVPDPDAADFTGSLEGEPPSPFDPPPGCPFHPRCPLVADICRSERPPLREIVPGRLSACHRAETLLAEPTA